MEAIRRRISIKEIIFILLGTALMAVSVNMVYDRHGMVTGGITGLGIVIKHLSNDVIPIWLTNTLLNIPLFVAAIWIKGWKYIGRTFFATVSLSVFLYIIPATPLFEEDFLLGAIFGGIIAGGGMGLVLMARSTTGGTDLLSALIHERFRHYSIPQILMVVDGVIVLAGIVVFGINQTLYAVIAIFISMKASDFLLEGMKFAKIVYIISDKYKEISDEILYEIDRGVSDIGITGMYSNEEKHMLFCAVSRKEVAMVLDIVHEKDKRAFVVVCDAREVMGEGFVEFKQ